MECKLFGLDSTSSAIMIRVLYSYDYEPITAIDMPIDLITALKTANQCRVPVVDKNQTHWLKIYRTKFEAGDIYWTPDDVLALKLMPSWLPGQLQLVQHLTK